MIGQATLEVAGFNAIDVAHRETQRQGPSRFTHQADDVLGETRNADYWWIMVFPGVLIFITVVCYNLVGDGLRDALDPRLKT